METLQQLLNLLQKDTLFQDWQKQHGKSYLTHFFCPISAKGELKSTWEIGFYTQNSQKMTIFVQLAEHGFEIKPEDDVFKKPDADIEALEISKVKTSYEDALKIFLEKAPTEFPKEVLGDGFIIIQTLQKKTLWNFTFVTKALKFVNLKLNATDGKVEDKQVVELVDKGNKVKEPQQNN